MPKITDVSRCLVFLFVSIWISGCVHLKPVKMSGSEQTRAVFKLKTPRKVLSGTVQITELPDETLVFDFRDPVGRSPLTVIIRDDHLEIIDPGKACRIKEKRWISKLKFLTGSTLDYEFYHSVLTLKEPVTRNITYRFQKAGKTPFEVKQTSATDMHWGMTGFEFPEYGISLNLKWLEPMSAVNSDDGLTTRISEIRMCENISLRDLISQL